MEMVLRAPTRSWLGVGWRPANVSPLCAVPQLPPSPQPEPEPEPESEPEPYPGMPSVSFSSLLKRKGLEEGEAEPEPLPELPSLGAPAGPAYNYYQEEEYPQLPPIGPGTQSPPVLEPTHTPPPSSFRPQYHHPSWDILHQAHRPC